MDAELKRKLVSVDQLNTLLEFMQQHPHLAQGLSRGRRGKLVTVKVWNACANKLNAMKDGAVKDGKGWSKYWCDWKYRVRRHALELRATSEGHRTVAEGSVTPLSSIEQTIMNIIGENAVDGVVIKTDPLADEESNDEDEDSNQDPENAEDLSNDQLYVEQRNNLKRPREALEPDVEVEVDDEVNESPPKRKSRRDAESDTNSSEEEGEDDTARFIRLEKLQLENAKITRENIRLVAHEVRKLSDIMTDIRDALQVKFRNLT